MITPIWWTSLFVLVVVGCGGKKDGDDDDDSPDACVGIECDVVNCGAMGLPNTSISGTVFAPNGTLPLNGVTVYVNRDPVPAFTEGVQCDRCSVTLPGQAIAQATSDAFGNFRLENVPAGASIPVVITTGKWRRQITVLRVDQCTDTAISIDDTRLPKNKAEGDIPKIALTTGDADSLECLLRKLGIDDNEITPANGNGRIHFYDGEDGVDKINGTNLSQATDLWDTLPALSAYDIVFFSCEGAQNQGTKSQNALNAVRDYTDIGGRVFASHWHNIWIGGNFQQGNVNRVVPEWQDVATWTRNDGDPGNPIFIDEISNPKGMLFADWMLNVGGSTIRDEIQVTQIGNETTGRLTALTLGAKAERWVQTDNMNPQMFQFTTPIDAVNDQKCGKVVYTDMHVSGDGVSNGNFPNSCGSSLALSEQEKALAFMFFDIASCVGGLF